VLAVSASYYSMTELRRPQIEFDEALAMFAAGKGGAPPPVHKP
jgi:hypothetical protein